MDIVNPEIVDYAADHTTPARGLLAELAAFTEDRMPAPQMMSGRAESRLLEALVVVSGATRVLEVGTFTGFGALSMAAALPDDGELVTIEFDRETAEIARRHIERSPDSHKVRLIVGDAREEIERLDGQFDLVYIDAWKPDYVEYYEKTLPKLSARGIIVADNALRNGEVLDPQGDSARGIAAFNERVQADDRVRNVLLTVGDGVMLAWLAARGGSGLGGPGGPA